jgi:hypothetical protein
MRIIESVIAVCACLAMVGCMTLQPLTVDREQLTHELKSGDKVDVTTKSGQHLKFAVESVDADGVRGAGQQVAFNDIQSIGKEHMEAGRTTLIVLGVVAAGAALAAGGGGGGGGY